MNTSDNQLKDFYYDKMQGSSLSLRNRIIKIVSKMKINAQSYLDVGCGDGTFTIKIAHVIRAEKIYGIDISDLAVKAAREKGIIASTIDLNCDKLPFSNRYFDFISSVDMIEHLVNSDNLLSEVQRTLKPDGLFLVSTPNLGSWLNIMSLVLGYSPSSYDVSLKYRVGKPFGVYQYPSSTSGHIKLYTIRALRDHLSVYGLKTIAVSGTSTIVSTAESNKLTNILAGFDKIFSIVPRYASGTIIVAKKNT